MSAVPLIALADQLASFIRSLPVGAYTAPTATNVGAIGGHVRHTIDHFLAWEQGFDGGVIDYDARERGTVIETDPDAAATALEQFAARLRTVAVSDLASPVQVRTALSASGELVGVPSTLARELAFVFSHAVHHNAILCAIANVESIPLPEGFGVAPSTQAYRAATGTPAESGS
ncbi:MAG: DinB family protein [Planctomycetota bacterium]